MPHRPHQCGMYAVWAALGALWGCSSPPLHQVPALLPICTTTLWRCMSAIPLYCNMHLRRCNPVYMLPWCAPAPGVTPYSLLAPWTATLPCPLGQRQEETVGGGRLWLLLQLDWWGLRDYIVNIHGLPAGQPGPTSSMVSSVFHILIIFFHINFFSIVNSPNIFSHFVKISKTSWKVSC